MSTNAQLSQQIVDLLAAWNEREAQFRAWLAGTSTGGPNGDGKYPLSDASGVVQLVDCPAKLANTVGGPAGVSYAAQLASEAARDAAITARDRAVSAETLVTTLRGEVQSDKALTLQYRNDAAAYASNLSSGMAAAQAAQAAAEAARDAALASETNADGSADAAAASAAAAAASAAAAAAFNPSSYYTKTEADARYKPIGYAPTWADITGKPTTFTPAAHSHVIADVTGLQAALDGKQAAGSYVLTSDFTWANLSGKPTTFTPSAHTHVIADVTGLQTALDGKQAAGSYVLSADFTWANLGGKPSTFTPAAHTHAIADVTGLQAALDAKSPLASPAFTGTATYGGIEIGYRSVPLTSTSGLTATTAVRGGGYLATGNITINPNVFAAGDTFLVANNSGSSISIVQGTSMTLRLVGTATTGTRTLAQRGIATILFVSATEAIVAGVT